jgi:hypothetical protein
VNGSKEGLVMGIEYTASLIGEASVYVATFFLLYWVYVKFIKKGV